MFKRPSSFINAWVFALLLSLGAQPTWAQELLVGKRLQLVGQVAGPVAFGDAAEGNVFKSYVLRLEQEVSVDDGADCGAQTTQELPIERKGMVKFLDKQVTLSAVVYCRTDRTGHYHLKSVKVLKSAKR